MFEIENVQAGVQYLKLSGENSLFFKKDAPDLPDHLLMNTETNSLTCRAPEPSSLPLVPRLWLTLLNQSVLHCEAKNNTTPETV